MYFCSTREFVCIAVGRQRPSLALLNLSKHLSHPPWQILWRARLKSKPCIIHECWWISITDTILTYCWDTCVQPVTKMHQHMAPMLSHVHNCARMCTIIHTPYVAHNWFCFYYLKMLKLLHRRNQKLEIGVFLRRKEKCIQSAPCVLCGFHHLLFAPTLSAVFTCWPLLCSAIVQGGNDEKWSYTASC